MIRVKGMLYRVFLLFWRRNMEENETKTIYHDSAEDLLILVDFQNVYLPGNEWACPTIERSMENTLRIVKSPHAPASILTKYMAPEDPVGCWKRYNEAFAHINADPVLCDLCDAIKEAATDENVIVKQTYSSLCSEQVRARLHGKQRLVLTGVVAECCILATMMDAIDLGYEVVYLYDCISGCLPENEEALLLLARAFSPIHTQVMSSEEYIRSITPR